MIHAMGSRAGLTNYQSIPVTIHAKRGRAVTGAQAEMVHFGAPSPALSAVATINTELFAPTLVILSVLRRLACLWLAGLILFANAIANRFWELPPGHERFVPAAGLFEHLGLVAAFCLVALFDRWSPR